MSYEIKLTGEWESHLLLSSETKIPHSDSSKTEDITAEYKLYDFNGRIFEKKHDEKHIARYYAPYKYNQEDSQNIYYQDNKVYNNCCSNEDWIYDAILTRNKILSIIGGKCGFLSNGLYDYMFFSHFEGSVPDEETMLKYNYFSLPIYHSYTVKWKYAELFRSQNYQYNCICMASNYEDDTIPIAYIFFCGNTLRAQELHNDPEESPRELYDRFSDKGMIDIGSELDIRENYPEDFELIYGDDEIKNNYRKFPILCARTLESLLLVMYRHISPNVLDHMIYQDVYDFKESPAKLCGKNHTLLQACQKYMTCSYLINNVFPLIRRYTCRDVENIILEYV